MVVDKTTREAALKALRAVQEYSRDGFTHGVDRVHLYYDDVEGNWLDEFDNEVALPEVVSVCSIQLPSSWQREPDAFIVPLEKVPNSEATSSLQQIAAAVWSLHVRPLLHPFQKSQLKEIPIQISQDSHRI